MLISGAAGCYGAAPVPLDRAVYLVYGQSLANQFFVKPATNASNSNAGVWNGSSFVNLNGTDNPGPYGFASHYQSTLSRPLGFINQGYDGQSIANLKGGTANMTSCLAAVSASGNKLAGVIWIQGETDAANAMAQATYEGHLIGSSDSVIDTIRANATNDSSKSEIPFLIVTLGREGATTEAGLMAIRDGLKNVALTGSNCVWGGQHIELEHFDDFHLVAASYETLGRRLAQTALFIEGYASYHRGPALNTFTQVDSTHVDVTITHRGGSDISPSSAINGFEVKDNGVWSSPSAAVRQSASTVRLTVSSITSLQNVRVFFGLDGGDSGGVFATTFSNPLVDNTTLGLPVEYGQI